MNDPSSAGWRDAVQTELSKITGRGSVKKRKTIIALVEAHLTGAPIGALWGKNGLPHQQTYYSTDPYPDGRKRGWIYDPIFSAVLANATQIATDWQAQKQLQEFEDRMELWGTKIDSTFTQSLQTAEAMLEKANKMLQFPLQEVTVEYDEATGEPTTVISPAKWSMDTVARFAKTAVDLATAAQALMELKVNGAQPLVQINNINQQNNTQNNTAVIMSQELKNADDAELNAFIDNLLYLNNDAHDDTIPQL